jgi:hypothetical protein
VPRRLLSTSDGGLLELRIPDGAVCAPRAAALPGLPGLRLRPARRPRAGPLRRGRLRGGVGRRVRRGREPRRTAGATRRCGWTGSGPGPARWDGPRRGRGGRGVRGAGRAARLRAWGIEPAPAFARYAREVLGVDVRPGLVQDHPLPAGELDAATMWHVLEHVAEPAEVLGALRDGAAALRRPVRRGAQRGLRGGARARPRLARAAARGPRRPVHPGRARPAARARGLRRARAVHGAEPRLLHPPRPARAAQPAAPGPLRLGRAPAAGRPAGAHDLLRAIAARPPGG